MAYILDTNIIRKLWFHFPKKGKYFEIVWDNLETAIKNGEIYSVDECYNELTGQFSKDNDDEFSKLDSFGLSSLNTKIEQLSSQVRSLREMCDHNFKVQSILMSYVVMLSAGYLTFVNRDELISPVKNTVKKEFDNIEDTTIDQILINLLENKYDGFKNSSHH